MSDPQAKRTTLLTIAGVSVFYDRFQAIHDVDLTVDAGEFVSIIGANGAGKSSLLKAIIGQARRVGGSILFQDRDIGGLSTREIVASGIALVPEGRRLFATLSVEENLEIGRQKIRASGIGLDEVYAMFPVLAEKRRQRANLLSGGQQQMVAIGRALLGAPRLLLCDEISLGLAPVVVKQLYAFLATLRGKGISVVVVEQDIQRALEVADRFYCLLEGRVTLSGRPADYGRAQIAEHYFGVGVTP